MQKDGPCASSFSEQLLRHKQLPINLANPFNSFSWGSQVLAMQEFVTEALLSTHSLGCLQTYLLGLLGPHWWTRYTRAQTSLGLQRHRCRATWTKAQEIICWSLPLTIYGCLALTYEWVFPGLHCAHWVMWKQTFLHFQLVRMLFRWTWTRNKNSFSFLPSICTCG